MSTIIPWKASQGRAVHTSASISLHSPSLKDRSTQRPPPLTLWDGKGLPGVPKHLLTKHSTVGAGALEKGEDRETSY